METLYPRNLWQALLLMLAGFAATTLLIIPLMLRDLSHDVETLAMGTVLFVSIWVVFYVVNRRKGHRVAYNFSADEVAPCSGGLRCLWRPFRWAWATRLATT